MSETQPLWKPIPVPVPAEMQHQAILGGWYKRGIWRTAVCDWYDGASGFQSERGGTATHYVCVLPIAPVPPAGTAVAASEPEPEPDPAKVGFCADLIDRALQAYDHEQILEQRAFEQPSQAGVVDASPDPAITDWDGDPTGPPIV